MGYGVLPMAIEQDIMIAGCPADGGMIELRNTGDQYE